MSTATIVRLPSPATPDRGRVRVDGDAVTIEDVVLLDPGLAAFVAERPTKSDRRLSSAPCASG